MQTRDTWREMRPGDHLVQFYQEDRVFMDSLEQFVSNGLETGEGVIAIATQPHLRSIEKRLVARAFNLEHIRELDQYIALDAETQLSKFMVNGQPDERLFERWASMLLVRARGEGRPVRAFGEMVALTWSRGQKDATLKIEQLWHRLCEREKFALYCAYPTSIFNQDVGDAMDRICASHSREVSGVGV